jgi:membrane protease YdiL (CAAX protease family)
MKGPLNASEKPSPWWQNKHIIWLESALFTAVYIADWKHHIILSKVPYLFLLGWLSLRLRGMRWRDVGFGVYGSWGKTLLVGTLAGVGVEMMELFCTQPLLAHLTGQMPDLSAFDRVAGNAKWLMVSLAFTWTLFAFGEELIFRGYLMNRITDLVGHTRSGWGVALVLASAIFGLSHFMQGITGVSENFIDGIILGALYLKFGRTLAVPIIAHGVTDTVDFLLIFFHRYPRLH